MVKILLSRVISKFKVILLSLKALPDWLWLFNNKKISKSLPGKDFITDNNTMSTFYTTDTGVCVDNKSLDIECIVKGYEVKKEIINICLNNG